MRTAVLFIAAVIGFGLVGLEIGGRLAIRRERRRILELQARHRHPTR